MIDGVQVVGHQLREQWRLWANEEIDEEQEVEAWRLLEQSAKQDVTVTGTEKASGVRG